jgi:hypothetical protein
MSLGRTEWESAFLDPANNPINMSPNSTSSATLSLWTSGDDIISQTAPEFLSSSGAEYLPFEIQNSCESTQNLLQLLKQASCASSGVILDNEPGKSAESMFYKDLWDSSLKLARCFPLRMALEQSIDKVVLLHFNNHRDYLLVSYSFVYRYFGPCSVLYIYVLEGGVTIEACVPDTILQFHCSCRC